MSLRECPFCGGNNIKGAYFGPTLRGKDLHKFWCVDCQGSITTLDPDMWNSRPKEDHLTAQLAALSHAAMALAYSVNDLYGPCELSDAVIEKVEEIG